MPGIRARVSIALVVLFAALPAIAQDGGADYAPYEARPLIEGVRLMAPPPDYLGFATSNILIVEQRDGIVVVDSGFARADGDRVVAYIRSFTDKPVKALIITHWHNDHPQGASQIQAAWPDLRIIATEATRLGMDGPARSEGLDYAPSAAWESFVTGQIEEGIAADEAQAVNAEHDAPQRARFARRAWQFHERIPDIAGTHLVAPTEILRDEILIDDPERRVRVMFLGRANTDGDAIVWLPNQRLVATGDVVVSPIPFGFFSYPADWIATLGRIKALEFELLVPGHGLPQSDAAYLDRLVATIADIRAQVSALAAQELSLDQVRERVDFSAQTAIFGPTNRRRVAFEGLWLRPMIENAYREATGVPIVQGEGEAP